MSMMVPVKRPRRGEVRVEFERFVDGCTDGLLRTGYLVVCDLPEAEDLVQETLLRVARRWPRVRRMDQPVAYARRILINLALDDARRRSRRRHELDPGPAELLELEQDPVSSAAASGFALRAELVGALRELPPRQRAVLVLRFFEDLSEARTAEVLGCSVGTVKSTTSRALARVRELLEPDDAASGPGDGYLVHDGKERQR
jgi:RNA polymerase sigma-70 factor (sigma-E family)